MQIDLWLGDCLIEMDRITDGSVDLILADLPYGTTACKWDTIIPFEPLWKQYKRVIKRNGAIVLTASQPFTSALVMSNPGWFKYSLVWEKDNATNFLNAKHQPMKVHEDVAVFSQAASSFTPGIAMAFNPQKTPGKPYRAINRAGNHVYHASPAGHETISDGWRNPRSVLRFNAERGLHGTQKPVALMEYLIRTYTNEGETVLDNTMGSGTTGVACLNTGRRFIGIEKDTEIFATAEKRITRTATTDVGKN
jgi:site-specific DNA-methyltransferase (adenine-specific)